MTPGSLDGSIDAAILYLQNIKNTHGPVRLDWDAYHHFPYDSSVTPAFHIICDRLETDEEYSTRLAGEAVLQDRRRLRDLAELARLTELYKDNK